MTFPMHPRMWWTNRFPTLTPLSGADVVVIHHTGVIGLPKAAIPQNVWNFEHAEMAHDPALKTIAYHWLIFPDGTCVSTRAEDKQGGATAGWNTRSLAICLWGSMGHEGNPTTAQLNAAGQLIYYMANSGRLRPGWWIEGHGKMPGNSTGCPFLSEGTIKGLGIRAYAYGASLKPGPSAPVTPSAPNAAAPDPVLFKRYVVDLLVAHLKGWSLPLKHTNIEGVRDLQGALNVVMGSALETDGVWGPATERAVINFQRWVKLVPDGVVGPKTRDGLLWMLTLARP